MNNPLVYVDENGEWFFIDDLIGFLVGGTINLIVNAIQGNIHSVWDDLVVFGILGLSR
jgi:hypothetical protein